MKYERVLRAIQSTPWMILPEKLSEIHAVLGARAAGGKISKKDIQAVTASRRPDGAQMVGDVGIVTCFGTISQRMGLFGESSGGVSAEALGARIDALMADRSVRCVVMAFDSPGGSVFGVDELASKIRAHAEGKKKLIGIADSMAASAAYYLASQCTELWVTPGGQVGSIGVFCVHEDWSKFFEEMGVRTELIYAGKFKTEGNPYEALGDDARAELQAKVDHYFGMFVAAVAKGRGVPEARVRADFGQGRMVTAAEAVSRGMADRVGTLEKLLQRLGASDKPSGASAETNAGRITAAAAAVRLRTLEIVEEIDHEVRDLNAWGRVSI